MAMGYGITKADFDVRMGTCVVNLRNAFRDVVSMNTLLGNTNIIDPSSSDAFLRTTIGYSAGEITSFRSAFTSLNVLNNVAYGTATQGSLNNFFFEAQKLTGLVL